MSIYVDIRQQDFDVGEQHRLLCHNAPNSGAQVLFVGKVRDLNLNSSVQALELSHYQGMTETLIKNICQQAEQRWAIEDIRVIHRVGRLSAQDQIVLVAVASKHRADAFSGAEFVMDELKTQATFWKKEIRDDGEHWLDMKQKDLDRSARWHANAR